MLKSGSRFFEVCLIVNLCRSQTIHNTCQPCPITFTQRQGMRQRISHQAQPRNEITLSKPRQNHIHTPNNLKTTHKTTKATSTNTRTQRVTLSFTTTHTPSHTHTRQHFSLSLKHCKHKHTLALISTPVKSDGESACWSLKQRGSVVCVCAELCCVVVVVVVVWRMVFELYLLYLFDSLSQGERLFEKTLLCF
jgi:hypothetical protein